MTRSRTLLAALAAVCALALIVVIATLVKTHVASRPVPTRHDTARRDTTNTTQPDTSTSHDPFLDDTFTQHEPPPEPNVFGIVVDEDGNPIEGARVTACHLVPYLGTEMSREAMAGQYDFGSQIEARDDLAEPESDAATRVPGGGAPEYTGFVFDGFPGGGGRELRVGRPWGRYPECLTGENGQFALRVCDKLWYWLAVEKEGYDSPTRILREPQEGICLVLYGPGSITGRVVDTDTGEPVPEFTARHGTGPAATGMVHVEDGTGIFQFDSVEGDWCYVHIEADGYVTAEKAVGPVPGRTTRVTFSLPKSASIVGSVVWSRSGEPVQDVVVDLGPWQRTEIEAWRFESGCMVQDDGTFGLRGLPRGTVRLAVRRFDRDAFGSGSLYSLYEQNVTLSPGKTTHVAIRVPSEPASVSGRVLDYSTREPIAGIKVTMARRFMEFGEDLADRPVATSDQYGVFRFPVVLPDAYRLDVWHEQYVMTEEFSLSVRAGKSVEGIVVELARPARIEGRVTDLDGRPVEATVSCPLAELTGSQTDEAGDYVLEGVRPGRAVMGCARTGHSETLVSRLVDVPTGETVRVDFILPQAYTVSGRTTIAGVIFEGCVYRLLPSPAETDLAGGFVDRQGRAEDGGRFVFEDVPPGKYLLHGMWGFPVMLRASMPVEVVGSDVEVELKLPTGMIAGRVLDGESGELVPCASISVRRDQRFWDPAESKSNVEEPGTARSDPYTGSYTLGPLGDGRYVVTASEDEYGVGRAEVDIVDGKLIGDPDIRLEPACEVRCTVGSAQPDGPIGYVLVTVRDTAEALVTKTWIKPSLSRRPTEHDEFILDHLAPGDYVLEAASSETAWQSVTLEVTQHGKNLVEFRLPVGKALVLDVTDPAGKPVHGAIPEVRDARGRSRMGHTGDFEEGWELSLRSASDGKGITRIEHLLPGSYTLTVRAAGYATAKQQVTVLDADETRVTVVLERLENR